MLIGIISDVHGNVHALSYCLEILKKRRIKKIYFLGDAVGYLPWGKETLNLLIKNKIVCQKGNHEAIMLGELPLSPLKERIYKIKKSGKKLSEKEFAIIKSWPDQRILKFNNKRVLLIHGSPEDRLNGYIYPDSNFYQFSGINKKYDTIIMGHTHRPFIKKFRNILLVNVGSCGLPRDQGNLGSFGILNTKSGKCEILRFKLDKSEIVNNLKGKKIHPSVLKLLERDSTKRPFGKKVQQ